MVDIKKIQARLLRKENEIIKGMPDRTEASIRRAMRLMAFEVGKIFKESIYGSKQNIQKDEARGQNEVGNDEKARSRKAGKILDKDLPKAGRG